MASVTFNDLLEQAAAKTGGPDFPGLKTEKDKVEGEVAKLEEKLQTAKSRLREIEARMQEPIRQAVKAAGLLNILVPAGYEVRTARGRQARERTNGSYLWEPGALPNSDRTEDLTPQQYEISRAMWAYSKGSKGSAGKKGEGVLTADEFWALVKVQTGKAELKVGEQVQVTLPNGRPMKVKRLDGVKTN